MGINGIGHLADRPNSHIINRRELIGEENEDVFWIDCDGKTIDHKVFNRATSDDEIQKWVKSVMDEHKKVCPYAE